MADKEAKSGAVTFTWRGDAIAQAVRDGSWTGLVRAGTVLNRSMKVTLGDKGTPEPGLPPKYRTGSLQRSITTVPDQGNREVRVGTNDPRGRWLEYGVTINPKRAKMLAIPLNKRAAAQYSKLTGFNGVGPVGNLSTLPLKLIKKNGKFFLLEVTAKGKIKKNGMAFVLKEQVRIWPRPWVFRSFIRARADMQTVFQNAIRQSIRKAVSK